jgi:hypothetical protein
MMRQRPAVGASLNPGGPEAPAIVGVRLEPSPQDLRGSPIVLRASRTSGDQVQHDGRAAGRVPRVGVIGRAALDPKVFPPRHKGERGTIPRALCLSKAVREGV